MMSDATIFAAALEIQDLRARAAFLQTACAGDDRLRQRVEALLKAHAQAGEFMESPAEPLEGTRVITPHVPNRAASFAFLEPPLRADAMGRLGHYDILSLVGQGGFGYVFRAFDTVLQRVVAVKVMLPELAATSPARKRFLREARSIAPIHHPNVVQVFAIEAEPLPYMVMEFISGESLQAVINRQGPLPSDDVIRIGVEIARGLSAAHAGGIIHRDIKPANVLLQAGIEPRTVITDFGLARVADDASLTQSGMIAGTPMYMSPEQALGLPLDPRSDLFCLGSLLYTLLTGRPPFRADSTLAILKRVVDDTPRPIQEIIPEVPGWICAIIEKLHCKDPKDRFGSATEVVIAFERGPSTTILTPRPPAPRTTTGKWLAAGIVSVLGIITIALVLNSSPRTEPTPSLIVSPLPQPKSDDLVDGVWGPPQNLGPGVNSPQRDLWATLTADECEIVFIRNDRLYTAQRPAKEEPFGEAVPLFNQDLGGDHLSPSITGDGRYLVFSVLQKNPPQSTIWASERSDRSEPFPAPQPLLESMNKGFNPSAPLLSNDGLTLLLTRATGDIVEYRRANREAPFTDEMVLATPINTPEYETAAWISDDRTRLLRIRQVKPPFEVYEHVRSSVDEPFSKGKLFTPVKNSEIGRPWVSPDGQRVYFHSRQVDGGQGNLDIWMCERQAKGK